MIFILGPRFHVMLTSGKFWLFRSKYISKNENYYLNQAKCLTIESE